MKIVVTEEFGFTTEQIARLQALGEVTFYHDLPAADEWLKRVKDADIILSGKRGFKEKIYETHDKFYSVPFVNIAYLDFEKLKAQNITVANCPGCNKDAVSEWIIAMTLNLFRGFNGYINCTALDPMNITAVGLTGKKACILGKGNIGSRVGKILSACDMDVHYFLRGDNLTDKTRDADIVIDCLGLNETTKGLLGKEFFSHLKKGSYFISITSRDIYSLEGLFGALDDGTLKGAALDGGNIPFGDANDPTYRALLRPGLLVTPHIGFITDVTKQVSNDMMIENVEKWVGKR